MIVGLIFMGVRIAGVTNVVGEIPIVLHGVVCVGPDYVLLILHGGIA